MIPRVVHYCWFGGAELPPTERECIAGWRAILPEYDFMLWDEDSFDIESIPFAKEAYEHGQYAFVSDVVRLHALVEYGGIYLDTDVKLLGSFDDLLAEHAFCGYENRTNVGTAVIGAERGFPMLWEMLDYYKTQTFVQHTGNVDQTTNVQVLDALLDKAGLKSRGEETIVEGLHILPRHVFFPRRLRDGTYDVSASTRAIHYGSASWLTQREQKRGRSLLWRNVARPLLRRVRVAAVMLIGPERVKRVELSLRKKMR